MIIPEKLNPGDRIAIISPATVVDASYVEGCAVRLREEGFAPEIMPSALGPACGSYSSSLSSRLADLRMALHDEGVRCILCARGGYGCVHLLPEIKREDVTENPKWLVGFSDVTALHALWQSAGVASLHAPMAKHISQESAGDESTRGLLHILRGEGGMEWVSPPSDYNILGEARGIVRGGNLAVLDGLAATPYDMTHIKEGEEVILFLEDIGEAIYKVERMFYRLLLAGSLSRIKGLIIGQFTEYRSDKNFETMEEMIHSFLLRYGIEDIPVAFDFPVGHVVRNFPIIEGGYARLSIGSEGAELKSI